MNRQVKIKVHAQGPEAPISPGIPSGAVSQGRWSDLYDEPQERPICYVARADWDAGGKLIPGTRLSPFFTRRPAERDDVYDLRDRIRETIPDASVFEADSVERAIELLGTPHCSADLASVRAAA